MTAVDTYRSFLEAKVPLASSHGFDVDPAEINPALKDFVQATVLWAAKGGRRAIFSSFGLHKTSTQLELARLAQKRGEVPLIVVPLGVRHEFMEEAGKRFGGDCAVSVNFIRRTEEAKPDAINLTNYESVREGKIDPSAFGFASLDEAAVLRGFGGTKTFREFMRVFAGVKYRFVATATPDPNEFIELLAYAAFLDVMDVGQAKTRFFKRDSTNADKLTIHPHKEREFWLWVASWALFVRRPSDLGFSDDGYVLPKLDVRWHEVASDHGQAGAERDGQGRMFQNAAAGVSEASKEKRRSLPARVAKAVELVVNERDRTRKEEAADRGVPGVPAEVSAGLLLPAQREGDRASEFAGEEGIYGAVSAHEQGDHEGEGTRATVRRNPGAVSGDDGGAGMGVRDLHTPADPAGGGPRTRDGNGPGPAVPEVQFGPGPDGGQHGQSGASDRLPEQAVVWCHLNDEQKALEHGLARAGSTVTSLHGSQSIDYRDELLTDWKKKRSEVLLTKPEMYGAGLNLQQSCVMVFSGIHYSFHDLIQAIHRIHRFGQTQPCTVHLIYSEAEREIRRNLEMKWARHTEQAETMSRIIREFGLARVSLAAVLGRSIGVERSEIRGASFIAVNNDCVDEARRMEAGSVDLIVTSIPFATQYEYSPSYNDFGHTDDNDHFWRQMDFLTPELLRVLEPGRVMAVHVKDRIVPGGLSGFGFQTVAPFSDEAIAHYRRHGFAFLARKTIVTDVVRENNQTYRLGWTEQCKDGSRMGAGMPEYVLLFRKPPTDRTNGYADIPVVKDKPLCDDHGEAAAFDSRKNWKQPVPGTGYSRGKWQLDAHGFTRSSGNRLLTPEEIAALPHDALFKLWRERSTNTVYDFDGHVAVTEEMDRAQRLPATFMLMPPHSWHPDVWTDVARMRTLNGAQAAAGREMHLCPLQFDIVDRLIEQFSMKGETVMDPFGGLGTVALEAVKMARRGVSIELNPAYHRDAVAYLREAEEKRATPTLFDLLATAEAA